MSTALIIGLSMVIVARTLLNFLASQESARMAVALENSASCMQRKEAVRNRQTVRKYHYTSVYHTNLNASQALPERFNSKLRLSLYKGRSLGRIDVNRELNGND